MAAQRRVRAEDGLIPDVTVVCDVHVCHEHVLVADLRRSRWLSFGVYLLTAAIYRNAMTKTDARLSAARAFSFKEMRELAERAGWKNFGHRKFPIGRQAIWL